MNLFLDKVAEHYKLQKGAKAIMKHLRQLITHTQKTKPQQELHECSQVRQSVMAQI